METFKIVVVLGVLAAGFAIGLAYLFAAVTGGRLTGDEALRHGILAFVVVAGVIPIVRRRTPR